MEGFDTERRGLFDGLRVPFDLNTIAFAFAFVILFQLGVDGIELLTEKTHLLERIGSRVCSIVSFGAFGGGAAAAKPVALVEYMLFDIWFLALWSFFGGAINRIAAMKIAREEGVELKDAAAFAASKMLANALTVVFVGGIIALFYLFFNATVAGGIGRIPYVGDLLVGILFPLVMISTFFIVFALALGILGFNLAGSAIATEASDTFDGVSRAWNYILARPWQVILHKSLIVTYVLILLFFGNLFLRISVKSLAVGWWGYGETAQTIEVKTYTTMTEQGTGNQVAIPSTTLVTVPGKAEFLYGYVFGSYTSADVPYLQKLSAEAEAGGATGGEINVAEHLPATLTVWVAPLTKFWIWLARQILYAYLVAYALSATTLSYFLLRKDVEGDDYSEINLEDDDEEPFDISPPPSPAPVPAAPPASEDAPKDDKKDSGKDDKKDSDKDDKKDDGKGKVEV